MLVLNCCICTVTLILSPKQMYFFLIRMSFERMSPLLYLMVIVLCLASDTRCNVIISFPMTDSNRLLLIYMSSLFKTFSLLHLYYWRGMFLTQQQCHVTVLSIRCHKKFCFLFPIERKSVLLVSF